MKLHYMYDESFSDLKDIFLSSLKDDFQLNPIKIPTPIFEDGCKPYKKFGGGFETWKYKISNIIRIIDECDENELFIFSDVDIVFYQSTKNIINKLSIDADILFLREFFEDVRPDIQIGNINIGFMAIRSTPEVRRFFFDVYETMISTNVMEQYVINDILYNKHDYKLTWKLFPPTFCSSSVGIENINKDIILYHANCSVGKDQKVEYINKVNSIVQDLNLCIACPIT